jgi:RNA ligase (TIGR02306 family)
MENLRSYPTVIAEGEEVVVTEKLHGTNCRVGFVTTLIDGGRRQQWMAGSRGLRRKEPPDLEAVRFNTYWYPHTLPGVQNLLREIFMQGHDQAVLYGEVFGSGIQSYTYGQRGIAFRAFDLMIDGQFVEYDRFIGWCDRHGVEVVPGIYRGGYTLATVKHLSEGESLVGGSHGREGVVVKPVQERTDMKIGRVIFKYVGDAYLFGKAAEQDTTDL